IASACQTGCLPASPSSCLSCHQVRPSHHMAYRLNVAMTSAPTSHGLWIARHVLGSVVEPALRLLGRTVPLNAGCDREAPHCAQNLSLGARGCPQAGHEGSAAMRYCTIADVRLVGLLLAVAALTVVGGSGLFRGEA